MDPYKLTNTATQTTTGITLVTTLPTNSPQATSFASVTPENSTLISVTYKSAYATILPQTFTTPGYPDQYSSSYNQQWTLRSSNINRQVRFVIFDGKTEENTDILQVNIDLILVFTDKHHLNNCLNSL